MAVARLQRHEFELFVSQWSEMCVYIEKLKMLTFYINFTTRDVVGGRFSCWCFCLFLR